MNRFAIISVLMLVVSACGGGGDSDDETQTSTGTSAAGATSTTNSGDTGSQSTVAPSSAGASNVDGIGEASISLGGETYVFGDDGRPGVQCRANYLGVFSVSLRAVDGDGNAIPRGGVLTLVLLHEGTDPEVVGQLPRARVSIPVNDEDWIADETNVDDGDVEPGTSQVDDYTINGNSASGTATFYERNSFFANAIETSQGTFEVTCAD